VSEAKSHRKALKLRLFGTWQAGLGEKPLPPLRSRKGEWLLALLALRSAPVSRAWLAGTLWPDSEESRALLYLRRELMHLRNALGPECGRLRSPGRSLQLDLAGADCDLLAFDAAIARADESSLEVAVSLYGGPLLEGCDEEWVILERQSREQAHLTALERLAESASARGDTPAAARRLRSVVALDPLRESAQRALMKALADSGDSAAAVQVYRDLRLYLRRELNAEVDPETTSLFHEIRDNVRRRSQPASRAVRTDRGARITRIPVPLTPLIGRDQELWEVRRRLGNCRLLTLTGAGGVGKTRLAIEIAEEMKDDFEAGVCFVELAALGDAALVPQAVMEAFGVKPDSLRPATEILADCLGSSDLLLVLDNCEHLIAACAELAGSLLGACAHLRVLTTSREPLGIAGESVWRVPSLSVPPATDHLGNRDKNLVAEVMEYEAVNLFVERAQQARSDFTLTVHNVESVSRVCRRLDGIPLAIELGAARVRSLTVEDIDSKLDQRFHLLTGGSRTSLPRQQTLRSLVDWSYDLLNEPEKALLCRLSVFAGGWTVEAAEQVCAGTLVAQWEVLDLLTSLADKNLIVAETFGSSVRYRLLETMRQYARDRLDETGDLETRRGRHLAHFLAVAEEAEPHLTGAEQQAWLERLEAEHDNIRAALEWSRDRPESSVAGLRLAGAICRFWTLRGHNREGRDWISSLLGFEPEKQDPAVRAKALYGAASMAYEQGDVSAARVYAEEELAIRRELGDRWGIANSLNLKANIAFLQGEYAAELAIRQEGLAIWRELGDRWGIAVSLGNLGFAANTHGDYASARPLLEESLALRRELGVRRGIAHSLHQLGQAVHALGDPASARQMYEESLAIDTELGNWRGVGSMLCCLGKLEFEKGDFVTAWSHLSESLAIYRDLGDRIETVRCLEVAAPLAASGGASSHAARIWGAAERLREEAGTPRPPSELPRYRQHVADARATLGSDDSFDAAWLEGRAMTMERAVELALRQRDG
jgi:predicted ATPase/DNA-binding SARP family transcriptional activator/tetratricopeptide (TPR) repeat protein